MLCHLFYFFKNPYTYHLASMISDDFRGLEPYYLKQFTSVPPPHTSTRKICPKRSACWENVAQSSVCQRKSGGDRLMNICQTSPIDTCFQSTSV